MHDARSACAAGSSDHQQDGEPPAAAATAPDPPLLAGGPHAAELIAAERLSPEPQFRIVREEVVHQGAVHEFDVAGHPQAEFHYAVVFPYHRQDNTVTLVREYAQGLNSMVWCLPTGAYDPRKHASYEACARAELSEEAHLAGGAWVSLMPDGHPGIPEVKWCRNRFHAYLVLDPQPDAQPGARDKEEYIQACLPGVCRVGLPELRSLMLGGEMLLPSITTCFWAMERIQELRQQGQQAGLG
ncbi:hypothetical protein CHLNCDRAFT_140491 [Chlorella variabilis]|uniref:Nudix hydrolase domain-containing protein n=1 Tax=Chlorella variabilis TaxID=554065 RepID=E1Z5H6_CHLVA|nr:hypothetical protein CHLNCDRAFT_140491 [Chlorella variabilis]EFN58472.1 hypothetical protein CHLNCDRAFT_140491 [Chlorella variabilis]|eukprot:XP_005850574.1 hypothetical protein CHLNCDRAFT_140491 [Chlorella variabilis]